jgi:hypothetical protein
LIATDPAASVAKLASGVVDPTAPPNDVTPAVLTANAHPLEPPHTVPALVSTVEPNETTPEPVDVNVVFAPRKTGLPKVCAPVVLREDALELVDWLITVEPDPAVTPLAPAPVAKLDNGVDAPTVTNVAVPAVATETPVPVTWASRSANVIAPPPVEVKCVRPLHAATSVPP